MEPLVQVSKIKDRAPDQACFQRTRIKITGSQDARFTSDKKKQQLRIQPPSRPGRNPLDDWFLEADPRHAELRIEQLGVGEMRSAATPGIDEVDREDDVEITGSDATRFRSVAARCNYLAFDRPDIQFPTKEICREMSKPTTGSLRRLQRLGQYVKGRPRLVWNYAMQAPCSELDVFTDSDWAGMLEIQKEHFRRRHSGRPTLLEDVVEDASHHCKVVSRSRVVRCSSGRD